MLKLNCTINNKWILLEIMIRKKNEMDDLPNRL